MYQALYRKYRPLTFQTVLGQDIITKTIKRQITEQKISHAYIFTGGRGTGKTSCAKILARAVNCPNPIDGDPCNQCESCKGILNGSNVDIFEIDAASNNGVDYIRTLREEVIYTPAISRYKVYIIDEVHMLSPSAFNALLKTLEEPPAHIIFVFATTEVHKVPATILSRCQRFDFKRITIADISKCIIQVAQNEGVEIEPGAVRIIARLADGAMRDALSILEQCLGGKVIKKSDVQAFLGTSSFENIIKALQCIINSDIDGIMSFYDDTTATYGDMTHVFSEFCKYIRDIIVIRLTKSPDLYLAYEEHEMEELSKFASLFTTERLIRSINILQQGLRDISIFEDKGIMAQLTLIKLCDDKIGASNDDLASRISKLEMGIFPADVTSVTPEKPIKKEKSISVKTEENDKPTVKKQAVILDGAFWDKVEDILKLTGNRNLLGFADKIKIQKGDKGELTLLFSNEMVLNLFKGEQNKTAVNEAIAKATGEAHNIQFKFSPDNAQNDESDINDEGVNEIISNGDGIVTVVL